MYKTLLFQNNSNNSIVLIISNARCIKQNNLYALIISNNSNALIILNAKRLELSNTFININLKTKYIGNV